METDTDDDCTRDTDQNSIPSPASISPFWVVSQNGSNNNVIVNGNLNNIGNNNILPNNGNHSNGNMINNNNGNNNNGNNIDGSSRLRKHKDNKICGVCGDKALGYNFDAISCESCKAFFRRNAYKGVDYFKCPYDERCRMDQSNRRFCKRCRLKKCFEIGMRKEYILTEEEKQQKRRKIEENRFRKMSVNYEEPGTSYQSNQLERDLQNQLRVNSSNGNIHTTANSSNNNNNASVSNSNHHPYHHSNNNCVTNDNVNNNSNNGVVTSQTCALTTEDSLAIEELLLAYRRSLDIQMDKDVPRNQASFADLVNIAELSIRRVIAMAKQVRVFKALPQSDQIHLLKGGSIELLILRSVMTFDKERQHFLDPVDQEETKAMSIEQLKHAETGTGLFEEHMRYVRSLAIDLRADETTLILLLVISLFSPDRGSLIRSLEILNHQDRYSTLLQRYLQSKYPPNVASQLFPRLLIKLTDIRNLNEEHSHVLLKVNPEGIQPLMKEVLELSHPVVSIATPPSFSSSSSSSSSTSS